MTETNKRHDTAQRFTALLYKLRFQALRRPLAAVGAVLAVGVLLGAGGRSVVGLAEVEAMQATDTGRQAELDQVRREAQHEVNALAARLSELQAQANRLNALGARLTQAGQLQDGEFEFDKPVVALDFSQNLALRHAVTGGAQPAAGRDYRDRNRCPGSAPQPEERMVQRHQRARE